MSASAWMLGSGCVGEVMCVAAGARVSTPRGLRPIESLREGDAVWAVDPRSGERSSTPIVRVRSAIRECLRLRLADDTELVCTPDHPIYGADVGAYLPAVSFLEGKARQVLQVDDEGTRVVAVQSVDTDAGMRRVFDLTVESDHHDFVANGVLVHNKSTTGEPASTGDVLDDDGPDDGAMTSGASSSSGTGDSSSGGTSGSGGTSDGTSGSDGSDGSDGSTASSGGTSDGRGSTGASSTGR